MKATTTPSMEATCATILAEGFGVWKASSMELVFAAICQIHF
jgi:hypothetical protein